MEQNQLKDAVDFCLSRIDKGIKALENGYPSASSVDGVYAKTENVGWTSGFWTGMLWLAYEFTGDEKYKNKAMLQVSDFGDRIINKTDVAHHDMGFLYSPSCVAAYKITNDEAAKNSALLAADNLCSRFQEKGQFIQAWGKLGSPKSYRLIIDCLLNIPLLFWAYNETGDEKYQKIALMHLHTAANVVIRDNGTTYHTYYFDPETGNPLYGKTVQGYSDDSIWARGQAWGIYGLALAYGYTHDKALYDKFIQVTDVFFDNLPSDNVPAWDMIFTDTKTQKDSSSAAIAVCGILEMNRHITLPKHYLDKADAMMQALFDSYLTRDNVNTSGILAHGVYNYNGNVGIDECTIWGDYYYMEALMRYKNPDWNSYWL